MGSGNCFFLPPCLVCPSGEAADSSLGRAGVRNNLEGLQAAMVWVRAAPTQQDLDKSLL